MSKPKKKRQHSKRRVSYRRNKYEGRYRCDACRHKWRGGNTWRCEKCGGRVTRIGD